MTKATRLEYGDSQMTHAMLFTGVDLISGKPRRWRVENSWGVKGGCKGYYLMTDKWFNEYNYEVVIDKKYLPEKICPIKLLLLWIKFLIASVICISPFCPAF